jgi:hypothetical protein
MTWFKVDDSFHSHPKALKAGNAALGLWVRCGSYCAQHLTDGFIPREIALLYGTTSLASKLVAAGLWTVVQDGWKMHDWHGYNPTSDRVLADRQAATERQRRAREAALSRRDNSVTAQANNGVVTAMSQELSRRDNSVSHGPPDPTRTQPEPKEAKTKPSPGRARRTESDLDRFEEFYDAYPRHIDRRDAEKAWANAIKRDSPEVIIAATKRYALSQRGKEKKYMKYPATWLNKCCYLDDPEQPDLRLVSGDPLGIHRDPTTGRVVEW